MKAAHARDARSTDVVLYERTDPQGDTLRVTRQQGMTLAVVRTDCPHPADAGGPHAPGVMLWPAELVELRDALTAEIERAQGGDVR